MIDDSPKNLSNEIRDAVIFRQKHVEKSVEIIRQSRGEWYRQDYSDKGAPDNVLFAYEAMMMPELAYSHPGVNIDSTRPMQYQQITDFLEMGLNAWLQRSRYGESDVQVTTDYLYGFGVMMVGLEPAYIPTGSEGFEDGALTPTVSRVAPGRFILDPKCDHWKEARFIGHEYYRDLEWIKDNAKQYKFDMEEANKLGQNTDDGHPGTDLERVYKEGETPPRGMIKLVDLWVKESNEIHTFGMTEKDALPCRIRKEKYYGPDTGPYQVYGAYTVPGDPYPISRVQANFAGFQELQAHTTAIVDASKSYARFVMVDATDKEMSDGMLNAANGTVVPCRKFNPQGFAVIEKGGANPEQIAYVQQVRDRWDRGMGMGDAQRGKSQDTTATAAQIAEANIDSTTAWVKECKYRATAEVLQKVCWFLINCPSCVHEVSRSDPVTGQMIEGLFVGGIQPGQEDIDWSGFKISIVQDSMSLVDNQVVQARAMQMIEVAPQLLNMKMTMQGLNVDWITDLYGEAMNYKKFSQTLFNPQAIQQMMMMQAQQQMMQQQQGGMAGGQGGSPPPQNPQMGFAGPPRPQPQMGPGFGMGNRGNQSFPTNRGGQAKPVGSPQSNGPRVAAGVSPLPKMGMPRTHAVGV